MMNNEKVVIIIFAIYVILGAFVATFDSLVGKKKRSLSDIITDYILVTAVWPFVVIYHAAELYKKLMK